jgi:hypothetical protein
MHSKKGVPLEHERHNTQAFQLPKEDSELKTSFPGQVGAEYAISSISGSNQLLGRLACYEEKINEYHLGIKNLPTS